MNRWEALQREIGTRLSARLYEDVASHPIDPRKGRRPMRFSWSLALAYTLTALVYAGGIAAGWLGLSILFSPWTNLLTIAGGFILLLMCIASRPRFSQPPDTLISRADYPMLYALSDHVARAMNAPATHAIGISADFTANYRVAGWRRRRYIEFGTPLLAILSHEERIAVIAHELSHGANRDPLRGQLLNGAVYTMATWASGMRPTSIGRAGEGVAFGPLASLVAIPFELAMLALSEVMFLLVKWFYLLVLRESQRAEYFADLLAATVAGSREMASALEKTYLFDTVDTAVQRHVLAKSKDPLMHHMAGSVDMLPVDELQRLRGESRERHWQVDSTHPPTAMRVDMLAHHPQFERTAILSPDEEHQFDEEVARLVASTERELINRKREALFG